MKNNTKEKSVSITEPQELHRVVAELARLKEERSEIEEKYRNSIEYANDAIVAANSKGVITSFNKKAEEMFGYDREEIIGKPVWMLVPAEKTKEETSRFKKISHNQIGHAGIIKEGTGLAKTGICFRWKGPSMIFMQTANMF